MPHYFFDVSDGAGCERDNEGLEFATLDAAEQEATLTAAEIGRDWLPTGGSRTVRIEVRDEQGNRLLTVKVSLEVDRAGPSPVSSS
jgi:hypothetical protein